MSCPDYREETAPSLPREDPNLCARRPEVLLLRAGLAFEDVFLLPRLLLLDRLLLSHRLLFPRRFLRPFGGLGL